jgi:hypothetical protein
MKRIAVRRREGHELADDTKECLAYLNRAGLGKQHLHPSRARQTRNRPLPALLGTMRNKID